jgi:Rrf2 family protein
MSYGIAFTQSIYLLIFVADKIRRGEYEQVPASVIAETINIPRPSVVKIIQLLTGEGIIQSGSGIKGGVRLLLDPKEITLDRIFNAIEGGKPLFRLDHKLNAIGPRPESAKQVIEESLSQLENQMTDSLKKISLDQFLQTMAN